VSENDLAAEVAALRDLFQRRLLEDRAKQRLYDELYTQLEFARSDLAAQFVAPIAREILLVVDRIDGAADDDDALRSISLELREILHRRGLRPVEALGTPFDPHVHEAVDRVSVTEAADHGRVVAQRRPGYLLDGHLLRPAQVVVGHHSPDDDLEENTSP
jgi:molecular chaperone GrpE